jgi:hypothetical protein
MVGVRYGVVCAVVAWAPAGSTVHEGDLSTS